MNESPGTEHDAQGLARASAEALLARDRAIRHLGIELLEIGPGRSRMRMSVREHMTNAHDVCHGGFTFALADTAFALACNSHNRLALTANGSIEFLRPARLGDVLVASASEQSLIGRNGIYDVRVENQAGELVALFRGKSAQLRETVTGDDSGV